MIDGAKIRRALLFALLFGGAMGYVAWRAGGLRGTNPADHEADFPETFAHPGDTARVGGKISVGGSTDAKLARDSIKIIEGRTVRFRSWTVAWKKATPKRSPAPDVGVQDVEAPHVVLYPDPQNAASPPISEGAAGTTRITAKTGVVEYQKDVRTRGHLVGDVAIDRFDPESGDFRLRTQTLDCTMESVGDPTGASNAVVEKRHARTDDPVTIEGGHDHLEGTGLEADLVGADGRFTLLSSVKGRFESSPGGLNLAGATVGATPQPTEVTCSGACDLVSLDAKPRIADRRWKAVFHDNVHVVHGVDTLDCDLLEVEFRMGESASNGSTPPQHVVATGHVHVKGRTQSNVFDITSDKATHSQDGPVGREVDLVVFEGAPVMNVYGRLGSVLKEGTKDKKPASPAAPTSGRLEIRCDGPVTMQTKRAGTAPTSPQRTNVVFEKNVVAKKWDDEKLPLPTNELHSAKATLDGTRIADGRFQPDDMRAEGGVDITGPEMKSHSGAATWVRLPELGIDRYLLNGSPVVTYTAVRPLPALGKAKNTKESRIVAEAPDSAPRHEQGGMQIDVYSEQKPEAGQPPRPYAVLSGGPHAVISQFEDDVETARITADRVDATIAQGRQLETASGKGNAHLWGVDADGLQRDVYGAIVTLDELVLPPDAPKGTPHPARVTAAGDLAAPAVAIIREKDGSRHDIRARVLHYEQDGSIITATDNVVANLDARTREMKPDAGLAKAVDGSIRITAQDARIELAPGHAGSTDKQRVRRVKARGSVFIDGRFNRVEGDELDYDGDTGIAEVRGKSCRVVNASESERYTSFVVADLIRAFFDVSDDPKKNGTLVKSSCPNGGRIIRYLDPPDAQTGLPASAKGKTPRQVQISSQGPMESTRTEATAVENVKAQMFELAPSGTWTTLAGTVYCDRAHMTFDADAPGGGKNRLQSLVATGADGHQVIVDMPGKFTCRADRVELDGIHHLIRVGTTSDKDVYVRETESGREFLCDSGTYDYEKDEWSYERYRVIEPQK